jgi:ABC-type uncharacterized transport system permease subunit
VTGTRPDEAGLASGLINTAQQVGGALGLAILAAIANGRTSDVLASGVRNPAVALTEGFQEAFLVGAGFTVLAAVLAAAALVLAFCLVGSGAGLLLGSTLSNEQQATSVSLLLGLGLAALGGSMVPLEIFPETIRTVAHLTPHAWANEGFAELLRHGGGLAEIGRELGVLLAYGSGLLALAAWRLRRTLTASSG